MRRSGPVAATLLMIAACAAPGASGPTSRAFACQAWGSTPPALDPAATARLNALAATGADAALPAAAAGDWTRRMGPPPADIPAVDASSDHRMTLLPDGTLRFEATFCSPLGCEEDGGDGHWTAVPDPAGTRLLVQRNFDEGGYCTELVLGREDPGTLREEAASAAWTRG